MNFKPMAVGVAFLVIIITAARTDKPTLPQLYKMEGRQKAKYARFKASLSYVQFGARPRKNKVIVIRS